MQGLPAMIVYGPLWSWCEEPTWTRMDSSFVLVEMGSVASMCCARMSVASGEKCLTPAWNGAFQRGAPRCGSGICSARRSCSLIERCASASSAGEWQRAEWHLHSVDPFPRNLSRPHIYSLKVTEINRVRIGEEEHQPARVREEPYTPRAPVASDLSARTMHITKAHQGRYDTTDGCAGCRGIEINRSAATQRRVQKHDNDRTWRVWRWVDKRASARQERHHTRMLSEDEDCYTSTRSRERHHETIQADKEDT